MQALLTHRVLTTIMLEAGYLRPRDVVTVRPSRLHNLISVQPPRCAVFSSVVTCSVSSTYFWAHVNIVYRIVSGAWDYWLLVALCHHHVCLLLYYVSVDKAVAGLTVEVCSGVCRWHFQLYCVILCARLLCADIIWFELVIFLCYLALFFRWQKVHPDCKTRVERSICRGKTLGLMIHCSLQ